MLCVRAYDVAPMEEQSVAKKPVRGCETWTNAADHAFVSAAHRDRHDKKLTCYRSFTRIIVVLL